jgi:hypothetical protein
MLRASRPVTSYMLFAEKVNVSSLVIEKEEYVESVISVSSAQCLQRASVLELLRRVRSSLSIINSTDAQRSDLLNNIYYYIKVGIGIY